MKKLFFLIGIIFILTSCNDNKYSKQFSYHNDIAWEYIDSVNTSKIITDRIMYTKKVEIHIDSMNYYYDLMYD